MDKYGVLVVDDSAVMRKTIGSIIDASSHFYVVGKARNGIDAIEKIKRLKPSIVMLDIKMPELDGLGALKIIMKEIPLPVVVMSNDPSDMVEALKLGAVDYVIKSNLIKQNNAEEIEQLYKRLVVIVKDKLPKTIEEKEEIIPNKELKVRNLKKDIIIIGSSTGGPAALQKIITKFPPNFPVPILLIQHMPAGFTKPLADRFQNLCQLKVKEAEDNETLEPGTIYIAPAGIQTLLLQNEVGKYVVKLKSNTNVETLYKPSIDVTLLSISKKAKERLLTIILTGMGDDGLRGCKETKKFGGTIFAESEETCVVYGMPKVVFEEGLVDKQLPLPNIYDEIMALLALDDII